MKERWKEYFKQRNAGAILIITVVILVICVYLLSRFLIWVEERQGVILDDPLFHYYDAVDLNIPIFTLIYASLILCLVYLTKNHPQDLVLALQTYSLLVIIRMAMMFVTPLEPPIGTIDLQDPLVFAVGTGKKLTKDLFFSGHTSILFMMFLVIKKPVLKYTFLTVTILVGLFVILQKVHYTVDVLAALFAAYGCYRIILFINNKYLFSKQDNK